MGELENERMRKLENERIRKLANEMEATRNDSEKIVSLFNFAKGASRTGKNFGKVCTSKRNNI